MKYNSLSKKITSSLIITWYIVIFLWFFWNFFYFFDLMSHFYLQYFVVWTLFFGLSILIKDKVSITACVLMLIFLWFNLQKTTIVNWIISKESDYYYLNANYYINSPDEIIENIKEYNPNTVIIVELNKDLHDKIKKELKFNNVVYHSQWPSSFWLFTNIEIEKEIIHKLTYPIWEIKTKYSTFFIVHPFPPFTNEMYSKQNKNFEEVINLFNHNTEKRKMIVWDFNSTFYSQVFKKYFWKLYYKPIYSRWNKWLLRIPIDYAIWNTDFFHVNWIDSNISDHSPLLINLK